MILAPSLRFFSSVFVIFIIVSQGPQGEGLIQNLSESRFFSSFKEIKFFIRWITWSSITLFLVLQMANIVTAFP